MNENKLKAMINWYLKDCEEKKKNKGLKDREERIQKFKQLTKEKIQSFTKEEMENFLKNIWGVRTEFKQQEEIINQNGLENFKKNLIDLMYGTEEI